MCKITNLEIHVIIQEEIAQFQISVDDSVVVQILDSLQQMDHVVTCLGLSHSFTTLMQLQQGLKWKKTLVGLA